MTHFCLTRFKPSQFAELLSITVISQSFFHRCCDRPGCYQGTIPRPQWPQQRFCSRACRLWSAPGNASGAGARWRHTDCRHGLVPAGDKPDLLSQRRTQLTFDLSIERNFASIALGQRESAASQSEDIGEHSGRHRLHVPDAERAMAT